jgi:hypothetical protein
MKKLKYSQLLVLKILLISFIYSTPSLAQTVFFNSKIKPYDSQVDKFYSSFNLGSSKVYFNPNDYYVHTYYKQRGTLYRSYYLANKTDYTPIPLQNNLMLSKYCSEYSDNCVQLNSKIADIIQTLIIESITTKPILNANVIYCTGLDGEIGRRIIAYDLKKDSVIGLKFLDHGVERKTYYLKDKIIADAEEGNWFELYYKSKLLDTNYENKTNLFLQDIKCEQKFVYLTHEDKRILQYFLQVYFEDYENLKVSSNNSYSFILGGSKLRILKDNLEIYKEINVEKIVALPEKAIIGY